MSPPRFCLTLLLPAATLLAAVAVLWGGIQLAREQRVEKIPVDPAAAVALARTIQRELTALESLYEAQLDTLARSDLNNRFDLRDAVNELVGIRQLSTLSANGQVSLHLLSDEETRDEAELPLPVFKEENLPLGRETAFFVTEAEIRSATMELSFHWIERDGLTFFHLNVSNLRSVFLLIDKPSVSRAIQTALADTIRRQIDSAKNREGTLAVFVDGAILANHGPEPDAEPDLIRQAESRFGHWQVRTRDPRTTFVEYDRNILFGAIFLALLLAAAGGLATASLHRALRLAERRVSFVNQVSHELKTPLTNILLNTDLAADETNEAGRKRLAMVQEEARRLSRLIDNVLTYSHRNESTPTTARETIPLRPIIDRVAEQFRPALTRREIELTVSGDSPLEALAHPDLVAQILGNLLSNIEKYAAAGGIACIHLALRGDEAVIRVSDAGPGIPTTSGERVFLPFQRLHNKTSEGASGTGLGLSIARELAGRMGGSLQLVSRDPSDEATGATFDLLLPGAVVANMIAFPDSRAS
ncbi:MAG TPA: HAMP domain-containing sensor histidine kinase [Verrucomicrobiales bacterium]|nr:HAMP domain-containing sensor histidine kinase [Verrucomicrobiales bacterium]